MAEIQLVDGINNVMFLKTFLCDQLSCKIEELDFTKVYKFVLEHRGLLRINCLWPLSNLTCLSLAGNCIKKIENLESLILLKELNLSFNQIRKIENLHTLVNIEKLLLNSNRIQLLENLDGLKRLKILNVSENCIEDTYFPFYLCQFKELRALTVHENPCYFQENEIDKNLIALMPQLIDLNYRKISNNERNPANKNEVMKEVRKYLRNSGTLNSKYKILTKRRTDFWKISGDEFCDYLFQNFKPLSELSDEGENFRRLNERLRKSISSFFEELMAKKECHNEYVRNCEENYDDLEEKSIDFKRKYLSNSKPVLENESDENEKMERTRFAEESRMSLLAEECKLHHQQQKILEDMKVHLSSKIQEFYDCVKNVHKNIEKETLSYIKAMSKNIESCYQWKTNVPYEFQPTSKENIFTNVNLKEFFAVFEGSCLTLINESETRHIEVIRDWKDHFAKLLRKNIIRHRKAVAEIIKQMESMKIS